MGNDWGKKPKPRKPSPAGGSREDKVADWLGCGIVAFGALAAVVTGLVATTIHFVS